MIVKQILWKHKKLWNKASSLNPTFASKESNLSWDEYYKATREAQDFDNKEVLFKERNMTDIKKHRIIGATLGAIMFFGVAIISMTNKDFHIIKILMLSIFATLIGALIGACFGAVFDIMYIIGQVRIEDEEMNK